MSVQNRDIFMERTVIPQFLRRVLIYFVRFRLSDTSTQRQLRAG